MDCPIPSHRDESKAWKYQQVPMYDPHSVLAYLFDDIGLQIPDSEIRKYWREAALAGCPWALEEPGYRIPVKIFGDDCVYDDRKTKAYAIVMSLPLWRPKAARNSRFLLWSDRSSNFVGFEGMLPVLARIVWSLNLAYDTRLPKTGYRFAVTEIGGDWAWQRFFWQFDRHWNGHKPCPFCNVDKFGPEGYGQLRDISWVSSNFFVNLVGTGGSRRVNPFILLRNFHVSLVQSCQLHNLNLGLLWTSNGAALATFAELGFFGNPTTSLALVVEAAWDDFKLFMKHERKRCSQTKFTVKMIFKPAHGAYLSAKGHNSRVIADWLANCADRAWTRNLGGDRQFGLWLKDQPNLLQLAYQNEQLAPLCFGLLLGWKWEWPGIATQKVSGIRAGVKIEL